MNTGARRGPTGFTLVEMLVAVLVGLLVLAGLHRVFVSGLTTQTTTSLEAEVNRKAQVAMDDAMRRLRGGREVLDAAPHRIAFVDQDGSVVRYWADGGALRRALNTTGYSGGEVVARDVSRLDLAYSDRFGQPTSDPAAVTRAVVEIAVERSSHAAVLRSGVSLRNARPNT